MSLVRPSLARYITHFYFRLPRRLLVLLVVVVGGGGGGGNGGCPRPRPVQVIGDGAITGGMAYEAMNNANYLNARMITILNDNEQVGAPTPSPTPPASLNPRPVTPPLFAPGPLCSWPSWPRGPA